MVAPSGFADCTLLTAVAIPSLVALLQGIRSSALSGKRVGAV